MGKHYGLDVPTLRELRIDVDKEWVDEKGQPRGVTKLKEIAAAMAQGGIAFRGHSVLEKLAANYGIGYSFLHAKNTGIDEPEWMDIQGLIAYITGGVNRMIAPPTLQIPTPAISLVVAEDHSGGGHAVTPPALAIPVPSVGIATATCSPSAVGAGIAHDDDPPTDTDETTATNNPTANDMHLLPSPGAVGDGFYFGQANPFDWVCLNIGTPGAGVWTITWKYWNGTTWANLPLKYDETNHFRAAAGNRWVHLDSRPGDWATTTILTYTLYFIKGEVTAYTSMTTQPLGTQAWIGRWT